MLTRVVVGGAKKYVSQVGTYVRYVGTCMYVSLHSPPFFCTPPRVYGIIFTPSIVSFFLSLGITSMEQDLLSFFCNRRRS